MKNLCYLIAFAICLAVTGFAHASPVDFQMNVLDPPLGGTPESGSSFAVAFSPCSSFLHPPAGLPAGSGCFEGINATEKNYLNDVDIVPDDDGGQVWTSLLLTFFDPTDILGFGDCGKLGSHPIFSIITSCKKVGDTYFIGYAGGKIVQGESFFIAESGISPDLFPVGRAFVNPTPEPSSVLLLSTGAAMFGLLLYSERRGKLRLPVRS